MSWLEVLVSRLASSTSWGSITGQQPAAAHEWTRASPTIASYSSQTSRHTLSHKPTTPAASTIALFLDHHGAAGGNPIPPTSASEPSGARVSTTSLPSRGWSLPTVFIFFRSPWSSTAPCPYHSPSLSPFLFFSSLFVSHGEWRYCFSIFNSFSLFLFTINLKKLLSRKNYKYSLDNFVSYKKNF